MKKVLNLISTVLLIALLVLAGAIAGPLVVGYKEMAVLSGSMEPNIPVGSIIYVDDDAAAASLQPGDIVTYRLDSSTFVTHRVVSVDTAAGTLVTRGDANESDDPPVTFEQVFGKAVFHLPLLGYVSMGIRKPIGIMVVTALLVVIILLNFLPAILAPEKPKKAVIETTAEETDKENAAKEKENPKN